jgi:hypothetical protein
MTYPRSIVISKAVLLSYAFCSLSLASKRFFMHSANFSWFYNTFPAGVSEND